jgi:hopene-associated glycosyltransferase HpnB
MGISIPILAGLSCVIWLYLVFFRGGFWRADQRIGDGPIPVPDHWPPVVVVIPARNEADVIAQCIASLLAQDYPHDFPIVLVDDDSSDATAAVARAAVGGGRLHMVTGQPLPAGWTGKVWAMSQGVVRAEAVLPGAHYVLFSDADIDHGRDALRRLVARAQADRLDMASTMVMLSVEGFWDRVLIPPFVFFFQMLYPFAWVNDPVARSAAAAGGCMLVRCSALRAAGGMAAIRNAVIDDCALARAIADTGGRLWLGLTTASRSLRPYGGFAGIWNMVARSAYAQLDHSPWRLMLCIAGMALVYGVPVAVVVVPFGPVAAMAGLVAYGLMCRAYLPTIRLYRQSWPAALLVPFSAAVYMAMTMGSAWSVWRGRGGAWKGRVYPHGMRQRGNGDS